MNPETFYRHEDATIFRFPSPETSPRTEIERLHVNIMRYRELIMETKDIDAFETREDTDELILQVIAPHEEPIELNGFDEFMMIGAIFSTDTMAIEIHFSSRSIQEVQLFEIDHEAKTIRRAIITDSDQTPVFADVNPHDEKRLLMEVNYALSRVYAEDAQPLYSADAPIPSALQHIA
jgi:hypothetical protein